MKKRSRLFLAVAALVLIPTFFVPVWTVSLEAPQYPEGLGMHIWLNQITGHDPYDLRRINQLNHYIGMKEIVPESIPELAFMPYIVGFLVLLGLLAALAGGRRLLVGWLALLVLFGVAGLVDFYLWGRDYGTDLDPRAPLKVPGLTYQPPLIGSKQLLNITATSYPAAGGLLFFLSAGLAGLAILFEFRKGGPRPRARKDAKTSSLGRTRVRRVRAALMTMGVVSLLLAACAPQPQAIRLGEDSCAYCRMILTNPRYGGQLLTAKGRAFKFDSVECLAAFRLKEEVDTDEVHSLWVVDFAEPREFVPAEKALFLHSRLLKSPMGLFLTSFGDAVNAGKVQDVYTGELIGWPEVLEIVRKEWLESSPQRARAPETKE